MNNGKELYLYSKSVFDEELSRYHRTQSRAGALITAIISILTVYSVILASSYFGSVVKSGDITTLILGVSVLVGFSLSFFLAFFSAIGGKLTVPPLNKEIISLFKRNDITQVYHAISEGYTEAVEHNRRVTDYKIKLLTYSYRIILVTMTFFVANISWFLFALTRSKGD
uniref:Uncharacterized protein n=1 Tax=Candidatus Kentrum sp. DK TaxID=2126562 RepID=A0A450SRX1_9GAMM|nr:MAG: hypothetical protein BECKDK2373B_GA0170837_104913 [Candidatus Kentron sp. DK]VFJ56608.1 MAG: hypothetical protein BECKDK2373C_GA0170839_105413 [Candidatus Kentron sp. DK]